MDARHGAFEALSRAVSLSRRMAAKVYVLMVAPPGGESAGAGCCQVQVRRRLELMTEEARAKGVAIERYDTEGAYDEEVIRFVREHKISLLVVESSEGDHRQSGWSELEFQNIRHRIACRVERVSPRRSTDAKSHT